MLLIKQTEWGQKARIKTVRCAKHRSGIADRRAGTRPRVLQEMPSMVREAASAAGEYKASENLMGLMERHCFICGRGSEAGALEGSGHPLDWVHLDCLSQPFDWDAPFLPAAPSA